MQQLFFDERRKTVQNTAMPALKFLKPKHPISFDDAMQRAVRVPPPPSGKKAKRKVWRKKQRKG
jgi:ribosome maturation protein Sdo1